MSTYTRAALSAAPQARPSLRLALTPDGPRSRLSGAWWPHSRNLSEQLPELIAELDGVWGRITRAAIQDTAWTQLSHSVPAGTHDVRVNWYDHSQDPDAITLFSYRIGEWELLVVPPESSPWRAKQLMTAAARPNNQRSARALLADGSTPPAATVPRDHLHIRTRRARNAEPAASEG
ncbi:hypothetical protein DN069_11480 [Streptacidiphilus pinicola]|uniref:Uncharacterized protein n=1 Tax=Streptacidiphilus pinicola TaxID=2219663 RepID=A0A2X0KEG6_9ACTN|nr:DUF5994 family protein [Streptacidiphilus pinicola]RAG85549.1 hypothetical protein DN069_11480 [Streptacidiphilus pinicola]